MPATRRQQIVARLEQGPVTVRELATELGIRIADVVDDLRHVQRSLGRRLQVGAAACRACGFTMTKRQRFVGPSRCPRCRSEQTSDPEIYLVR